MVSILTPLRRTLRIVSVLSALLLGSAAGAVPYVAAQSSDDTPRGSDDTTRDSDDTTQSSDDTLEAVRTDLVNLAVTVATGLRDLSARADTLETTTTTHATEIDTLETTTTTHTTEITALETTTGTHTTEIDTLETTVGTLSDNITGLETTTGTHATEIAALEEDLTGLEEDLTSLEENLESLEESIEDLKPNANVAVLTEKVSLTSSWQDVVSVKITPRSSAKRIRLRVTYLSNSTTNPYATNFRILQNGTEFGPPRFYTTSYVSEFVLFDVPSSTAEQTYTLQARRNSYARDVYKGTSLYAEEF